MTRTMIATALALLLAAPLHAQDQAAVWRDFAMKIDVGSELTVRLRNGQKFRATLIGVRDDTVLVQPRTRVPVEVQPVPFQEIQSLERRREGGGIGPAKAAAIGVASGVAGFLATLLIVMAAVD